MIQLVQFVKNSYATYVADKATYDSNGSIFFCTDKPLIIAGGFQYGVSQDLIESVVDGVKSVTRTDTDSTITITVSYYKDTTPDTIITLNTASATKAGLMSKEDKTNLDKTYAAVFGDGEEGSIDDRIKNAVDGLNSEINKKIDNLDMDPVRGIVTFVSQSNGLVTAASVQPGNGLELTEDLHVRLDAVNKILSTSSNGLLATLNLDYSAFGTLAGNLNIAVIQLKGINGEVISEISAEPFLMDRFLKGVNLDGSTLTFSFEVDHGDSSSVEDITIDLSNYIKAYNAGNGLNLEGLEFSVKVKEGDKYLTVDENGVATKEIDNAIDSAVNTAKSELSKSIKEVKDLVGEESVETLINNAIDDLNAGPVGGTNKVITTVSQTDGIINATAIDLIATNIGATAVAGCTATDIQGILAELANMWVWREA